MYLGYMCTSSEIHRRALCDVLFIVGRVAVGLYHCMFAFQTAAAITGKNKFCKDILIKYDARLRERVSTETGVLVFKLNTLKMYLAT